MVGSLIFLSNIAERKAMIFVPVESLIYFLPRRSDGEIGVALCLRVEDLENLKKDQEWAKHAEHIG